MKQQQEKEAKKEEAGRVVSGTPSCARSGSGSNRQTCTTNTHDRPDEGYGAAVAAYAYYRHHTARLV